MQAAVTEHATATKRSSDGMAHPEGAAGGSGGGGEEGEASGTVSPGMEETPSKNPSYNSLSDATAMAAAALVAAGGGGSGGSKSQRLASSPAWTSGTGAYLRTQSGESAVSQSQTGLQTLPAQLSNGTSSITWLSNGA